ncbi:acylneuraminate cytidylyltransferase family protein [Pseudoalteromonas shioyasakiensis]|uniref:acylneuraminate cytidylyltransferase family protein n=1 Tax=Pseudoalteromonas shioyasakiensis TaxID=1190813 RepID=UPI002117CF4E|nr:acylneuraminate cytidylyltransferase family protein [Pseudoalteromonas shioyasakiensis]MCQ8877369.1 acylneuraminate cytidylyltransferase family protein [Pseudoalteromonas shioyasakiensis]
MIHYAFIFARGGSKGLPRKNILPLAGKPLINWSIDIAKSVPAISRIFVSTDDQEIAKVARTAGAEIINRPNELASDTASEWLSWQHALEWVEQKYGAFDYFISLPATSPLRETEDVEAAIYKLKVTVADICITVSPSERSPFFNMVKYRSENLVDIVISGDEIVRRQDVPEVFDITTVAYVTTPSYIRSSKGVMFGDVTSICVPKERAVDIDTQIDFDFAQFLANKKVKK